MLFGFVIADNLFMGFVGLFVALVFAFLIKEKKEEGNDLP